MLDSVLPLLAPRPRVITTGSVTLLLLPINPVLELLLPPAVVPPIVQLVDATVDTAIPLGDPNSLFPPLDLFRRMLGSSVISSIITPLNSSISLSLPLPLVEVIGPAEEDEGLLFVHSERRLDLR